MKNWNHAETELQEFSQHTATQEPEVETKQPMKVENSTSGKALEAITTSTVKPVQDTPKMSEYQPLSFTKDAAEVLLIETTKSVIKLGGKPRERRNQLKRLRSVRPKGCGSWRPLHLEFHKAVGKSKHHTRSERKRITNVIDGIGLRGTLCKFRTRSHLDSSAIYSTT